MYRRRWTIETAFQEMEKTLNGEIKALGYPKAALFSFCMALVAYNVMCTVKAALRAAHGAEETAMVSGFYLADEVKMSHRGMIRAIPKDEWVGFQEMSPSELAAVAGRRGRGRCPCRSTERAHVARRSRSRRSRAGRRSIMLPRRRY